MLQDFVVDEDFGELRPREGKFLTKTSQKFANLERYLAGLVELTCRDAPLLKNWVLQTIPIQPRSQDELIDFAAHLCCFHDAFYVQRIPLPQAVLKESQRAQPYFLISDVPEIAQAQVSFSDIIAKFDKCRTFFDEESQERYKLRDTLCERFSRHFFARLTELLSGKKKEQVISLVDEVSTYQSVSLRCGMHDALQAFKTNHEKSKDPLVNYAAKALEDGINGTPSDASSILIEGAWQKIIDLVPEAQKKVVRELRQEIQTLEDKT